MWWVIWCVISQLWCCIVERNRTWIKLRSADLVRCSHFWFQRLTAHVNFWSFLIYYLSGSRLAFAIDFCDCFTKFHSRQKTKSDTFFVAFRQQRLRRQVQPVAMWRDSTLNAHFNLLIVCLFGESKRLLCFVQINGLCCVCVPRMFQRKTEIEHRKNSFV